MTTFYDLAAVGLFIVFAALVVVVQAWLAFRTQKMLHTQNFRLTQANLALSEKPAAWNQVQAAEATHGKEIEAERDGVLAANGVPPVNGTRRRGMEI